MTHDCLDIRLDRPLEAQDAQERDVLGRINFARSAASALRKSLGSPGLALSVEGPWGSGKTSTLALIESIALEHQPKPLIIKFNPWLIGDRENLLRQFFATLEIGIGKSDHVSEAKTVAKELAAYSKVFDYVKLIPGAEPWASIIKSVIQATGEAVGSVAKHKEKDIEGKKESLKEALKSLTFPIFVFIDDVDRLFPNEIHEIIRIVKAVGDLPNVAYVLAWDPKYVSEALRAASIPRSDNYLEKVVQIRMPLPSVSLQARHNLFNQQLARLDPNSTTKFLGNNSRRLTYLYSAGLRDLLEQPRDFDRIFNTIAMIEPLLRGEIALPDIIGLAALIVKAPSVHELLIREPRFFVHALCQNEMTSSDFDKMKSDAISIRKTAIDACDHPRAVRSLVHFLFPDTARAENAFTMERAKDSEGHLAAPSRIVVALQMSLGTTDVSLFSAHRFLHEKATRANIVELLNNENSISFLDLLDQLTQRGDFDAFEDIGDLCIKIARLPDLESFRLQQYRGLFQTDVAAASQKLILKLTHKNPNQAHVIASVIKDRDSLSTAVLLIDNLPTDDTAAEEAGTVAEALVNNVLQAIHDQKIFKVTGAGRLLGKLAEIATHRCKDIFRSLMHSNEYLDWFIINTLGRGDSSGKGEFFIPNSNKAKLEVFHPIAELKKIAHQRLLDTTISMRNQAAWKTFSEERRFYSIDASEADD